MRMIAEADFRKMPDKIILSVLNLIYVRVQNSCQAAKLWSKNLKKLYNGAMFCSWWKKFRGGFNRDRRNGEGAMDARDGNVYVTGNSSDYTRPMFYQLVHNWKFLADIKNPASRHLLRGRLIFMCISGPPDRRTATLKSFGKRMPGSRCG